MGNWPNTVQIKEVGPRDGLQNEPIHVSTKDKIAWINMLSKSGVQEIEYSSFVHPKWVPQLSDAHEVGIGIERREGVHYTALIPNQKGLELALATGVDGVNVFMSASNTHNLKNINKSITATYPVLKKVIDEAKAAEKPVTAYISTVFDCPYEGKIKPIAVLQVCDHLLEYGVDNISLGDTIGSAVPMQVEVLLEKLLSYIPSERIIMHYHNTRGMAIANIMTAMNYGINRFDSSIGGLGGCPYAPGAQGNVATNDVLYLLHGLGVYTGIDAHKMNEAALFIQHKLGRKLPSKTLAYHTAQHG